MRTILAALALFVGFNANAAESTVLLKTTETPFIHVIQPGDIPSKALSILADGTIVVAREQAEKIAGKLDDAAVTEIKFLIAEAAKGEIKSNFGQMVCMAIPTRSFHTSANDGEILLESGAAPCGGHEYNSSEAATKLLGMLRELKRSNGL